MEDFWSLEDEAAAPTFRHFTREELERIEAKIFEKKLAAKKRAEKRAKNILVSNKWRRTVSNLCTKTDFLCRSMATAPEPANTTTGTAMTKKTPMKRQWNQTSNWKQVLKSRDLSL